MCHQQSIVFAYNISLLSSVLGLMFYFGTNILLDICMLASFLLKQIFLYDVGYDVPISWDGSVCPVFVA